MSRKKYNTKNKGSAGQNRAATDAFFKKNRGKSDVIELPSGLQYLIKDEGIGKSPDEWSTVEVNQRILLIDGTVIRNTYDGTQLDSFTMAEAIDGLKEGLPLMKEGAKFRFFVPPDLAWGKRGSGSKIGPYATLIFDIRLEKVI